MYFSGRRQIPHGRFERFVPHPMLNGAWIEASTEHPRGVRRSECFQIELLHVHLREFGDRFAFVEHVLIVIARRRRENEFAGQMVRVVFQPVEESLWYRHFTVLPSLWVKPEMRFCANFYGSDMEHD